VNGEDYTKKSVMISTSSQIFGLSNTRLMRWASHVARMEGRGFHGETLREINQLAVLGLGGRIILKWIFQEVGLGEIDWIDLAQERDKWRAVLNTVMNIGVPRTAALSFFLLH
jgi:hypothetical protein